MSLPRKDAEGPEPVVAWETTSDGIDAVGLRIVVFVLKQGMGNGVVVEAGDVPKVEGQVDRGLAVGTEEGAVLRGVLIGTHVHMERGFNGCYGAFDLHIHGVARAANDLEAVSLGEADHGVVVLLGGAKLAVNSGTVRKCR